MATLDSVRNEITIFDTKFKRPGIDNLANLFEYIDLSKKTWAEFWAINGELKKHAEFACVYLLFDESKSLQYIGKADAFGKRMFQHFDVTNAKWKKIATGIGVIPIPSEHWFEISAIEAYLIKTLKPAHNKIGL
tara:strand:- start:488 stop:889 length:402 start_codon:yes stop_codon:yes gene_type:complete